MKQFLPLMILLAFVSTANAQTASLLFNENFESYTNGNITGQGGWTTNDNGYKPQVATASPLTYTGYASGSRYVNLTQGDWYFNTTPPYFYYPDDPYRNFTGGTSLSTSTATTFFMSFLVRVPATSGTTSTGSARPTISLRTSTGNSLMNFYVADNGGSSVKFGIQKDEASDGTYASGNYNTNTVYLVVIRYDLRTGSTSDDRMYMWINPSLASEPSTGTANASVTSGSDGLSGNINGVQLFQESNSATVSLDALKVAYARNFSGGNNSAPAWDALNPSAVPLPVTFGEVKAYSKESGIQVDWTVHTEINVSHYELERSTNGVSFEKIASVTAQAKDGVLYYTYFDAMAEAGIHFYRIKNVDLDSKYSYSPIVKVSSGKSSAERITIYPNPVQDNRVNLQTGNLAKGTYTVEIFNAAGQQVYTKVINHSGGAATQSLQLPANTKAGIYTIRVKSNEVKAIKQFLVQ